MRKHIGLSEMRERIAQLIFGDDWIGPLPAEQGELLKAHGPFIRRILRSDGSTVQLDHVQKCPPSLTSGLDTAIGRQARMQAQYVTVDSWLQDRGLPVDPRRPADRKSFNAIVRREAQNGKSALIERRPGPKPAIFPRVQAAMINDVSSGELSLVDLAAMTDKRLEERYGAKRERVRAARSSAIAYLEKHYRQTPPKKK